MGAGEKSLARTPGGAKEVLVFIFSKID
jgi:hypothetical protein